MKIKKNVKRNINIDIIRGMAILMVLVYHICVIGNIKFNSSLINTLISSGGDLGVTIFFILSGFSIYKVLSNKQETYTSYLKSRLSRLSPHYYISIIIVLLLTPTAVYLSKEHIFNIISHFFYFHNLFISFHGAISGVCWTLGVIFQFYLIAPLLQKLINKYPKTTLIVSIIITLLSKGILYYIILPSNKALGAMYYFVYGRQLLTAIDAFVIGMFISKYEKKVQTNSIIKYILIPILLAIIILIIIYGYNYKGISNVLIYSKSLKGVLYFTVLSIFVGLFIYVFSTMKISSNMVSKFILFISKHEYAIYIWHLLILKNLLEYSSFFKQIVNKNPIVSVLTLSFVLIITSYLIDVIISSIDFTNLEVMIKNNNKNVIKLVIAIIMTYVICQTVNNLKLSYNYYNKREENINKCTNSCLIYKNVKNKLKCSDRQCKYIYIDTENTGYLYFYQLRYYLSPNIIDHYNNYAYLINYGSEEQLYNYLKSIDVDYIIVRENNLLENAGYNLDPINGTIYRLNKNASELSKILLEVK